MIRGDFLAVTETQLNSLEDLGGNVAKLLTNQDFADDAAWDQWVAANRAAYEQACASDKAWMDSGLGRSLDFRRQMMESGFRLTAVYPCFYQGWECDEWGALGTKEGKTYLLETGAGVLAQEIDPSQIKKVPMITLQMPNVGQE